jgi:hypothetical protein
LQAVAESYKMEGISIKLLLKDQITKLGHQAAQLTPWNGTEWNRMEQNGTEWNRMEQNETASELHFFLLQAVKRKTKLSVNHYKNTHRIYIEMSSTQQ